MSSKVKLLLKLSAG